MHTLKKVFGGLINISILFLSIALTGCGQQDSSLLQSNTNTVGNTEGDNTGGSTNLSGKIRLSSTLSIASGKPQSEITNATVYAIGQESQKVTTNSNGEFTLLIDAKQSGIVLQKSRALPRYDSTPPKNQYGIMVMSNTRGHGKKFEINGNDGDDITLPSPVEITEVGSISGKVTLQNEADNTGIMVYIPGTSFMALTDASGKFTISDVPEGTYLILRAEKDGYNYSSLSNITVQSSKTTTVSNQMLLVSTGAKGAIVINNGDSITTSRTVDVNVSATDNAILMVLAEEPTFQNVSWETIQSYTTHTFTSDGDKTLYIKFADANGLESTTYSDSITIDTNPRVTLSLPSGTISSTKPTLTWTASTLPNPEYHIQVSASNTFSTIFEEATNLTSTSYALTNTLSNATTYYYRVSIIDENGTEWSWSESNQFTVDIGTVTLLLPSGATSSTKPAFDWTDSTLSGVSYKFQLSTDSNFTNLVTTATNLTNSTHTLSTATLSNNTTYYWRVAVIDANGVQGSWATTSNFSVDISSVALSTPTGEITSTRPTFDWTDSILSGVSYSFQLSTNSNFTNLITTATNLTNSTHTLSTATLSNNTTYYWRVAVIDANGVQGSWASSTFTVNIGTVTLSTPDNATLTNNQTPAFTWNANTNASTYTFTLSTAADLSNPLINQTGISAMTYTLQTQLSSTSSTTYYWAVTPIDANGVSGTRSDIRSLILDTTGPTGSVVINSGDASTSVETVTLTISATDTNNVSQMYVSLDGSFTDGAWETYATTKSATFSSYSSTPSATLTAYVKFKDSVGNTSSSFLDDIALFRTLKSGTISSSETWTLANSPYVINGDVGVPSGVTLTIEAGASIQYAGAYTILIKGTIVANGTATGNIVFTSIPTSTNSNATQLKFQEATLTNSQLSYVTFEKASKAVYIYAEPKNYCTSGAGTYQKTIGYLTISNATISSELYTGCESGDGTNGIIVDNSTISNTKVTGAWAGAAKITIQNSTVTNSTLWADSYHSTGIIVSNSTVTNSTFSLGCCSAKIRLDSNTSVSNSTISEGGGSPVNGPLELSYAQLTNTSINLSSAQVTISDSTIAYSSSYTGTTRFKIGNGTMSYSRITGNGSGTGFEVTGYSGYSATGGFTISYSDITGHDTGIVFSGGSGTFNISNSNLNNNTSYSLKNMRTGSATAQSNYWGSTSSSTIGALIYDGLDDINYGNIDYTNFLSNTQSGTGPR